MWKKNFLKFLFLSLLFPQVVFGAICSYLGGGKNLLSGVNTSDLIVGIPALIRNIIDFIISCLVRYALILLIIIGGGLIMLSTGDPKAILRGKTAILTGVIGAVIIMVGKGLQGKELDYLLIVSIGLGLILYVVLERYKIAR